MCRESLEGLELLARIASDLREFSRDDKDDLAPMDIHHLLDKALILSRAEMGGRIEIERRYGELPPVVCIPGRMTQVFLVLIVNAVQAMTGKGRLRLTTSVAEGRVTVDVEDTGCGIKPEHLPRIFDPFFTTKSADQGTGLGLTIAQTIVNFHHGALMARSEAGQGSVMTVVLPVRQEC
jgi:two-component system NtrC family sensor kinase